MMRVSFFAVAATADRDTHGDWHQGRVLSPVGASSTDLVGGLGGRARAEDVRLQGRPDVGFLGRMGYA